MIATRLLLSFHCLLGSAVLPGSPSESLKSKSSSVKGFRQLWWSPKAWWRRVRVGTTPSADTQGSMHLFELFCLKVTVTTIQIISENICLYSWCKSNLKAPQNPLHCPQPLSGKSAEFKKKKEAQLNVARSTTTRSQTENRKTWHKAVLALFCSSPPPGWCRIFRSWIFPGQWVGHPARGRALRKLRPLQTDRAKRRWVHVQGPQPGEPRGHAWRWR